MSKIKWSAAFVSALVLVTISVVATSAQPNNIAAPETNVPASFDQARLGFLPVGIAEAGESSDTVGQTKLGKTIIYATDRPDPGPQGAVFFFRAQQPGSGLKPVWEGRGWWLGAPEKTPEAIAGAPVQIETRLDTGLYQGKPYEHTWIQATWTRNDVEYQLLGINTTKADFLKMANSVKTK